MTLSFCSSWTQQIANPDLYLLHMKVCNLILGLRLFHCFNMSKSVGNTNLVPWKDCTHLRAVIPVNSCGQMHHETAKVLLNVFSNIVKTLL